MFEPVGRMLPLCFALLLGAGGAGAGTATSTVHNFDLSAVQAALRARGLKTWLICDFRGSDPGGRRFLRLREDEITTRRFCYAIPARGQPKKLVHAIEPAVLDHLPGEKIVYRHWREFRAGLRRLARVGGGGKVAVAFSPDDGIPYADRMPAGLLDLVRKALVRPVSSADLEQHFQATASDRELELQRQAADFIVRLIEAAFDEAARAACAGRPLTEVDLQQWMRARLEQAGYLFDHPPIVAVGAHAADPHYAPEAETSRPIEPGSLLLIDAWAKLPGGFYADATRMAYLGDEIPKVHADRFALVIEAQDAALGYIEGELAAGRTPVAWRADRAARDLLSKAGYGAAFLHRTGHSITTEVHGSGAHLDDLETHDTRGLIPRTCFSIEPGVYLAGEAGYRSEIDVCILPGAASRTAGGGGDRPRAEVTTQPRQRSLRRIGCHDVEPE